MSWRGKRAVVTGGLGFIGSNLAIRLVELGASVTVVDLAVAGCGANQANLGPVSGEVRLVLCDVGEPARFADSLAAADVIFNLAGEVSHLHSVRFPERDLELNTLAQLRFVQACARHRPGVRVVYAGTRQVYGVPEYLPVDERHPVNPVDFNGVHKYAATQYHLMLSRYGSLDAIVLRLTNVYGPRMALDAPCQGFMGTFLRLALAGETIEVFGDGRQLRDPLYVDDAVEALVRAGAARPARSRAYNIGGPAALEIGDIAAVLTRLGGCPPPVYREFPEDRKVIDIGGYSTDSSLAQRELGWQARAGFEEGARRTIEFYRAHRSAYLPAAGGCRLCTPQLARPPRAPA